MRIRRIVAKDLKSGATITGDVLLEATDALNIDNMEGIAPHRSATGETILSWSPTTTTARCNARC